MGGSGPCLCEPLLRAQGSSGACGGAPAAGAVLVRGGGAGGCGLLESAEMFAARRPVAPGVGVLCDTRAGFPLLGADRSPVGSAAVFRV